MFRGPSPGVGGLDRRTEQSRLRCCVDDGLLVGAHSTVSQKLTQGHAQVTGMPGPIRQDLALHVLSVASTKMLDGQEGSQDHYCGTAAERRSTSSCSFSFSSSAASSASPRSFTRWSSACTCQIVCGYSRLWEHPTSRRAHFRRHFAFFPPCGALGPCKR